MACDGSARVLQERRFSRAFLPAWPPPTGSHPTGPEERKRRREEAEDMTDAQRLAWPVPLGIRFGDVAKTKCSFCIHVTPRPLFQVC